jgi:hypothetical protein
MRHAHTFIKGLGFRVYKAFSRIDSDLITPRDHKRDHEYSYLRHIARETSIYGSLILPLEHVRGPVQKLLPDLVAPNKLQVHAHPVARPPLSPARSRFSGSGVWDFEGFRV